MYNVSDSYKTFIKKPSRSFECRITLGNRVFNNSDIIQIVPTVVQPSDRFSIGNTVSQSIDITLKNDGVAYASVGEIKVEIGLKINNSIEYIPLGTFNIDDVSKTDYTVKLTCYDNMVKFETGYFSKLGNNPTLQEVVNELATITGVQFTGTIPNYVVTKLEGYTCREVLGYVASVCGGNAYITRDNKFTIIYPHEVNCTITADNYFSTGYKLEDQTYKIGMITCQNKSNSNNDSSESDDYDSVNDKNTISVGSLSSDTMELTFENPWVTQSILNDIYNKLKNFSYLGYTLKWQGDLSLDPLDIITVVDKNNITRKALVFANKLTYNGGLSAETSAKGETKNSNSFSASGSANKNIERLSVKLLIAEKAIINKASIADLQANSARIDKLDTNVATINTALIDYANISNATIADLVATKATVSDLTASVANIDSALINKANIADLTAANATISNLSADVANIKTLVNGNLTSANIQSLVLTSSKVTVDNGFIKNAMIESLDATKINTGSLNTSKISVTSSDGSLLIAGATQQFKDKNGKVRIQMGQDAQGNFNFILVASDGTTTLIDGTGVKEKAIADKLIKTNMVADQAIGSQQINYSSFVTGFNAATNTSYINASKVAIDLTGQTLDIAFNNMNTTVTSVQTTANTAKSTADTASSNASSAVSTANSANTSASTALSNANSAVDTANTAKTTATTASTNASNAVNTANSANSTANTANTNANTALTNASTAVNTANTALSTANNIQVGGRNLILNGDFSKGTVAGSSTAPTNWSFFGPRTIVYGNQGRTSYNLPRTLYIGHDTVDSGIQQSLNLSKSTQYTVSFSLGRENVNNVYTNITYYDSSNNVLSTSNFNHTMNDTVQSFTFTTPSTFDHCTFIHGGIAVTYGSGYLTRLGSVKLEVGNKKTDWTPAPEDVDQSIASVKTVTETNTTSINAIQGQISTLISNTTITNTDGTTTQLKDAYNGTVNTINSMKTTIGEHTTDIDANTKNITSVTSRTSTLETNLSSISATLSSTKSTVDTHTTQISTANTNITTALNNASSAVSTANSANTTANSAKTTATTASTNASNAVTTANSASSNASTALSNSNTAISTANTASTNASNAVSTANKASTDVATLTTTVTNTVSRVSSLELTTSGLTTRVGNTETAISSLSIGGRNLLIGMGSSVYTATGTGDGTTEQVFITNYYASLESGKTYTFSCKTDGTWGSTNGTDTVEVYLLKDKGYSKIFWMNTNPKTFTCDLSGTYYIRFDVNKSNTTHTFKEIKIEQGTVATSWTPAPEDVDASIASVKDYATQTINSNVSTINQTTDSIKASVQSLQSSVSTINTTLGNKADSSTVTSVTNRVSTLETNVNGINASITTLNSNVSSVTTTANAAKSAIDNLSIGGRNLIRNSIVDKDTSYWSMGFGIRDTNIKLNNHNSVKIRTTGSGYDGIKSNGYTIPFKANTTYTFTIWAYRDSSSSDGNLTKILRVYMPEYKSSTLVDYRNYINITSSNLPDKTWTKFTGSFTTKNDSTSFSALQIDYNNVAGTSCVWISDIKVEEGTESTSWTPAPEDTDAQITTVNSSVSSLQSSVSILQNQIALKVEQSNIDSAVTTINGKIDSTNATISSMQSSINLQLNSITSKVQQTISTKNLCVNSAFKYDVTNGMNSSNSSCNYGIRDKATYTGWGYSVAPVAGDYVWYQNFYGAGDNYIALPCLYAKVKPNTTYTVSFYYVTGDGGSSSFSSSSSYIFGRTSSDFGKISYSSCLFQLPITFSRDRANWRRCVMTITTKSDTDSIMLRFGWGQGTSDYIDMLVSGIQIEEGSSATDWVEGTNSAVGTTVSQNSNAVMTSFNNISKYFQVSADGAKFGDFLTGAYTKMSQNGLEHVDSYGATPYFYLSFVGKGIATILEGNYLTTLTIEFSADVVTKLNGKIPKAIASLADYFSVGDVCWGGVSVANVTATSITIVAALYSKKTAPYTGYEGGDIWFNYLIIA